MTRSGRPMTAMCSLVAAALCGMHAAAQDGRPNPIPIRDGSVEAVRITLSGAGGLVERVSEQGGVAGGCTPQISSHTDADFTGGSFTVQAGFAESEVAAAEYQLTAADFPLRVDLMEMIFATSGASQSTVTEWSIIVWEGNPDTGTLVAEYSSDGIILPHIELPPGTNGINVQVSVDPDDPDQIIVGSNPTNSFTIGYRIDMHNQQTQNPCFVAPPTCCNIFPTTDTSGLSQPTRNWLKAVDCGIFGCAAGWSRFSQLGLCQPSGDWVMRATWTPFSCPTETGACCLTNGNCLDGISASDCDTLNGTYLGDQTECAGQTCPEPTQACCFVSPGGCLDLDPNDCLGAGGFPQGIGTDCGSVICFPIGACCLPDGDCMDAVSPEDCAAMDGVFQGDDTFCVSSDCPVPEGSCCFDSGFCLVLDEESCGLANGTWGGPGTDCADGDNNGTPDACEGCSVFADLDGDCTVGSSDLAILLAAWSTDDEDADLDGSGTVDAADLAILLANWGMSG